MGTVAPMEDNDDIILNQHVVKSIVASVIAAVLLFSVTLFAYKHANSKPDGIILPGGTTYLGPPAEEPPTPPPDPNTFSAPPDTPTSEQKGQIYPFSLQYPEGISLGFYPDDPFDSVTVFYRDTDPNQNIILRVENLEDKDEYKQYINKNKREFAENWGFQYTWTKLIGSSEFTNEMGLKGYWAQYQDDAGNVSGDNYFFEVPNHPELVIWMGSNKVLEMNTFNRMVHSLTWKEEQKQQIEPTRAEPIVDEPESPTESPESTE